jgi:hypothetical protein
MGALEITSKIQSIYCDLFYLFQMELGFAAAPIAIQ